MQPFRRGLYATPRPLIRQARYNYDPAASVQRPGWRYRALTGTRSRWSLARRLGSALHAAVGYGRTSPPDAFGRFRSRLRGRLWYIGGRFALWTSMRF